MTHRVVRVSLVLIVFVVGMTFNACTRSSEQAEPTTPPADEVVAEEGDPEAPAEATTGWADMDHEARAALMREQVMPAMTTAFQEFDGEEFATFNCATCHGETFQDVNFAMPNGLHPIDPATIPGMASSDDEEVARYAAFMFGQVTPGMVGILGVAPYDMETHQGFGCFNCHVNAAAAAE